MSMELVKLVKLDLSLLVWLVWHAETTPITLQAKANVLTVPLV